MDCLTPDKNSTLLRRVGREGSVGIATTLRGGQSGDRIPVGGELFRTCPYRPWGPPSLLYNGYRVFPGGKAPQLSTSQKALGTIHEDGNVTPKPVGATVHK
jgi:hypothetical protein